MDKTVIDGSILVQEAVLQHSKSTCRVMARDRLGKACSSRGEQINLVFYKYLSSLIGLGVQSSEFRVPSYIDHH